jgi:hypothetical protein
MAVAPPINRSVFSVLDRDREAKIRTCMCQTRSQYLGYSLLNTPKMLINRGFWTSKGSVRQARQQPLAKDSDSCSSTCQTDRTNQPIFLSRVANPLYSRAFYGDKLPSMPGRLPTRGGTIITLFSAAGCPAARRRDTSEVFDPAWRPDDLSAHPWYEHTASPFTPDAGVARY